MARVQAAAVELCEAHGFDGITVDDIARAAEVSPASVYRYFGTKEAVLLWDGPTDAIASELAEGLDSARPLTGLRDLVRRHARDDATTLARHRIIFETPALVAASWRTLVEHQRVLADALGRGLEAEVLASAALGAIEVAYDYWQRGGKVGTLDRFLLKAFAPLTRMA